MPPKRKNKPANNGYWEFVMETRSKNPGKDMEHIKSLASSKWAGMGAAERAIYSNRARLAKNNPVIEKLTSDGIPVDELERQIKEAADREKAMKEDINSIIHVAKLMDKLDEEFFIIIHINHLCHVAATNTYIPCEIAAAAFNLRTGVQMEDVFHSYIRPGKLPLGYYGLALSQSNATHQLLGLVHDEAESTNVEEVFLALVEFMKTYKRGNKLPPLYTPAKCMDIADNVFTQWREACDFPQPIQVYCLEYLVFALRNGVAERTIWPSDSFAYDEVDKDIYAHASKITCTFHEESDIYIHCSQSIAIRYGFLICDLCCSDMGIALNPGYHIPGNSKVETSTLCTSRATSVMSVNSVGLRPKSSCSLASADFDTNFPALGGGRSQTSSASSLTFRSLRPNSNASETAGGSSLSVKGRDHSKLKLPRPTQNID